MTYRLSNHYGRKLNEVQVAEWWRLLVGYPYDAAMQAATDTIDTFAEMPALAEFREALHAVIRRQPEPVALARPRCEFCEDTGWLEVPDADGVLTSVGTFQKCTRCGFWSLDEHSRRERTARRQTQPVDRQRSREEITRLLGQIGKGGQP